MTDDVAPPSPEPATGAVASDDQLRVDWLLADLVRLANVGIELPVTLWIGGMTVGGTLISGRTYLSELAATFLEPGEVASDPPTVVQSMSGYFLSFQANYPEPESDHWSKETTSPAIYIHLREARGHVPAQNGMPQEGLLWRGRMAAVTGFSLGTFKTEIARS